MMSHGDQPDIGGLCRPESLAGDEVASHRPAARGANVCPTHGGSAPQVKAAAERRLAQAADVLVERLLGMAVDGDAPDHVALPAIRDALDRAGLGAKQAMSVGGPLASGAFYAMIMKSARHPNGGRHFLLALFLLGPPAPARSPTRLQPTRGESRGLAHHPVLDIHKVRKQVSAVGAEWIAWSAQDDGLRAV
jgi:hypothetical protein